MTQSRAAATPVDDRARYRAMSDVVLFDVFFEASTQLGARLVAKQDAAEEAGDHDAAAALRERHHQVRDEREAIDARDRAAQIDQLLAWRREWSELGRN